MPSFEHQTQHQVDEMPSISYHHTTTEVSVSEESGLPEQEQQPNVESAGNCIYFFYHSFDIQVVNHNKKGQLSLTNPRDACETFARFMYRSNGV